MKNAVYGGGGRVLERWTGGCGCRSRFYLVECTRHEPGLDEGLDEREVIMIDQADDPDEEDMNICHNISDKATGQDARTAVWAWLHDWCREGNLHGRTKQTLLLTAVWACRGSSICDARLFHE